MLMTTIGSQYWPVTTEGRALCFPNFHVFPWRFSVISQPRSQIFLLIVMTRRIKRDKPKKSEVEDLRADINALRRKLAEHRLKN